MIAPILTSPHPDIPKNTGRYFVILKEGVKNFESSQQIFKEKAGMKVASYADFAATGYKHEAMAYADVITYDHLGIALIGGSADQVKVLEDNKDGTYALVPEKIVNVLEDVPAAAVDKATWGLVITNVLLSRYTGQGVKVAILDTGFDPAHPDFTNRQIVPATFVHNEIFADDRNGHGTHCIGVASGTRDNDGLRYGVAGNSTIYSGKVINSLGAGSQQAVLDGITWAADNGCKVISMSFGTQVMVGITYDIAYERAAQYALSKGAVLVAAAGNNSHRSGNQFDPISSPANCPSILAVAAIDSSLNVANFSNRGINPDSLVDISAPGMDIYSSWKMPIRYRQLSGTSMATPFVAGVLALLWEKFPDNTTEQITTELLTFTKPLPPLTEMDVGKGLVMAPN